jgi:hypothetical protein
LKKSTQTKLLSSSLAASTFSTFTPCSSNTKRAQQVARQEHNNLKGKESKTGCKTRTQQSQRQREHNRLQSKKENPLKKLRITANPQRTNNVPTRTRKEVLEQRQEEESQINKQTTSTIAK